MRDRALVILSTPLTLMDGALYLSDRAHIQTLTMLGERFRDVAVVARVRTVPVLAAAEHVPLASTGARFEAELPDYGNNLLALARMLLRAVIPDRQLRKVAAGCDVLFVEAPSPESLLVWRLAMTVGRPYVVEVRGETIVRPSYMRARFGIPGLLASGVFAVSFALVRRYSFAGMFVGEEMRLRYARPGRPAVSVSSVRLPAGCPRAGREYRGPARNFLYVGHLERVKDIPTILQSLHEIAALLPPDWRLDLVGDGPDRATLERLVGSIGLADHVTFHGRVAWGESLFDFYDRADLLVMASLTEGNSRTLLEGIGFALPAVSTSVGEAPRLLLPEALVRPGDVAGFTRALRQIAASPAQLTRHSAHNAKSAARFTPARMRDRRGQFLDRIVALCGSASSSLSSLADAHATPIG